MRKAHIHNFEIYNELAVDADLGQSPKFPDECPICGELKTEEKTGWLGYCMYGCGGGYEVKPQIQRHHDVWWGHCGRVERKEAK